MYVAFDPATEQKFISLSKELLNMDDEERHKFLNEHSDISRCEKARVLNTFISILERIEDYETCNGLLQLKQRLQSAA
jgi:hypothetical protein